MASGNVQGPESLWKGVGFSIVVFLSLLIPILLWSVERLINSKVRIQMYSSLIAAIYKKVNCLLFVVCKMTMILMFLLVCIVLVGVLNICLVISYFP